MKVFIPYQLFEIGGPISFLGNFTSALKTQGHTVLTKFEPDFDVLFVISACKWRYILYAKLRGKKIVQRLDGVYHAALPGLTHFTYRLRNLKMQLLHNYVADHVIYQSAFCQKICEQLLGQRKGASSVIFNGAAEPAKVQPATAVPDTTIRLLAYAKWRRRDQIEPLIATMAFLPARYHLSLYGPYTPRVASLFKNIEQRENITYHGALAHDQLLSNASQFHLFLFSDMAYCPNSIIEALSAGLPVVAYNRGSVPELIEAGYSGEATPVAPHNPYQQPYPFTTTHYQQFAAAIQQVTQRLPQYSAGALDSARRRFSLSVMIEQYLAVLFLPDNRKSHT